MAHIYPKAIWIALITVGIAGLGYGQSLGDVAREQRQKQQAKKDQDAPKVITNEDIPEHPLEAEASVREEEPASSVGSKSADEWKSRIAAQRKSVENLQSQIDRVNSSIRFAPGNCVRNCAQYNEQQIKKQDDVQRMQAQLDEQKKTLEDMQEAARKQGFGNSVYEP
jgi:hypothetical protein